MRKRRPANLIPHLSRAHSKDDALDTENKVAKGSLRPLSPYYQSNVSPIGSIVEKRHVNASKIGKKSDDAKSEKDKERYSVVGRSHNCNLKKYICIYKNTDKVFQQPILFNYAFT